MDQGKMPRVPPNHKVVRRLNFGGDDHDQARADNFHNTIRELAENDKRIMIVKYNFDMVNDAPLEGDWKWTKKIEQVWVGAKINKEVEEYYIEVSDDEMPITDADRDPPTRRRKMKRDDSGKCRNHVKKRLIYEKE